MQNTFRCVLCKETKRPQGGVCPRPKMYVINLMTEPEGVLHTWAAAVPAAIDGLGTAAIV